MTEATEQVAQDNAVSADLLQRATASAPQGVALEEFNPMENIPTIAVGKEFKEGMTISGYYEESQLIESTKFKKARYTGPNGKPAQWRHVLRIGSPTGDKLAIWTTGELKMTFDKLVQGAFIAITYKGKGENGSGNDQHFFEYKRAAAN